MAKINFKALFEKVKAGVKRAAKDFMEAVKGLLQKAYDWIKGLKEEDIEKAVVALGGYVIGRYINPKQKFKEFVGNLPIGYWYPDDPNDDDAATAMMKKTFSETFKKWHEQGYTVCKKA